LKERRHSVGESALIVLLNQHDSIRDSV